MWDKKFGHSHKKKKNAKETFAKRVKSQQIKHHSITLTHAIVNGEWMGTCGFFA